MSIFHVEVVEDRIHGIYEGSIKAHKNYEDRKFLNFYPTNGASEGTPINQMDSTGRMYTPEEILEKGILTVGKNQSLAFKDGVPEYMVVPDHTETTFYLRSNGQPIQLPLGETPDKKLLTTVPPPDDPGATFNGKSWVVSEVVLSQRIRKKRNLLLAQSDHLVIPDYPVQDLKAVQTYRQALRDVTSQKSFPTSVIFPDPPEDVQEQAQIQV